MADERTRQAAEEFLATKLTAEHLRQEAQLNRAAAIQLAPAVWKRVIRTVNGRELLISVGQSPDAIRFDPAENLLLVVNRGSGDLAVIRARLENQSLLTMIPVGDHPQELAVKLF